jgi:hypothetical protein
MTVAENTVELHTEIYLHTMSNTLDFISTDDSPGTTTFLQNITAWYLPHQDVLVTQTQVQPLYQQQTPHLQSNTQTHLDIQHSTLGYDLKFKHRNFREFSIKSLAANSDCPLVHSKFRHPQGPSNTNSKRRNQLIQLPLWS